MCLVSSPKKQRPVTTPAPPPPQTSLEIVDQLAPKAASSSKTRRGASTLRNDLSITTNRETVRGNGLQIPN